MATERTVAVQLKEDWTMEKASLAFLFHPSTHLFREVKKNTFAWLHVSEEFDGHYGNEWATITPLTMTPNGLSDMFPGDHSKIDIPCRILRVGLRVLKDWTEDDVNYLKAATFTNQPMSPFCEDEMLVGERINTGVPELIVVKKIGRNFTPSDDAYLIHRDYVDFGYEKADVKGNMHGMIKPCGLFLG
ncbi:hypothetical protein CSIM01_12167 [Colletotrichum simmondsii]|uniref:Uncharacterized protein n=1 Tax=Colletotrichum simmondsii TaxID=703756 RepID=A0A135T774_9PEZI|nr:hypothetical protein CSIM01_12167 [Colletotrichum simmondsii]